MCDINSPISTTKSNPRARMASNGKKPPHFVLLPFLAQGHLIPMVDFGLMLANRGVAVTILVTPRNGDRVKSVIDRAADSGLSIHLLHLKLPCAEAGLPEGCESIEMLPSQMQILNFFSATAMLRDQVEELLQQLEPKPSCIFADMNYAWPTEVAQKMHIPRLAYHVSCCISFMCPSKLGVSDDFEDITSNDEYFVLPDGIPPSFTKLLKEMHTAEKEAFGTVANTFDELEPKYVRKYNEIRGKKFWSIGPLSLYNSDKGGRDNEEEHPCLKWLDSQEPSTVIYVCFGSEAEVPAPQLIELGLGLESSNCPFIWVVRNASDELKKWLSVGKFEERIRGRGLLIQGWAPQKLILSHPSLGGFITHCGWNSTIEAVTAGLPVITWPLSADHYLIEKFIVNVIKTGIRVGGKIPVLSWMQEGNEGVRVKSDDIKMAIAKLMGAGEEGTERRERARKLREMAESAVKEGGSSYNNVTQLIQEVVMQQPGKQA